MDGIKLYGKKDMPAVLLLHGFGGNVIEMQELAIKLNALGHTVEVPLHPGHGLTFKDFLNTKISLWYDNALKCYDALKARYKDVIVMGLSMGGSMTLRLGIDRTPYQMVTMSAPVIGFTKEQMEVHTRNDINNNASIDARDKERYYEIFYHLKAENNRFYEADLKYISEITSPILIIQGLADGKRYLDSYPLIQKGVSSEDVRVKTYEGGTHVITMGPLKEAVFKDILEFVRGA